MAGITMEPVFDQTLLAHRRVRALGKRVPGADFLLQRVSEELAFRLGVVERSFSAPVQYFGALALPAERAASTGKTATFSFVDLVDVPGAARTRIATPDNPGFQDEEADLIMAPLSLHLTNDTPGAFIQIRRALRPDGLFLAAVPAAGTLQELREALLAAETELHGGASPHVHPFADVRDYGALLQRAGFALPVADIEPMTVRYSNMFALMADLRAMGMTSALIARQRKFATRSFFLRAAEIYAERFSDPDGRIRASFPVVYLSGWAPHESQQKPLKPGSAKASLAAALGTTEKRLPD